MMFLQGNEYYGARYLFHLKVLDKIVIRFKSYNINRGLMVAASKTAVRVVFSREDA
jgi:hypothetical protein